MHEIPIRLRIGTGPDTVIGRITIDDDAVETTGAADVKAAVAAGLREVAGELVNPTEEATS